MLYNFSIFVGISA